MTPWILGLPLLVFAACFVALLWESRERIKAALDRLAEGVRETLESIGRLP